MLAQATRALATRFLCKANPAASGTPSGSAY
jgi:hypothetical protein